MGFYSAVVGGSPKHDYSETEKVVGTWLDGRSIYERTYIVNNVTMNVGFTWFTLGLSDVEVVLSGDFYAYSIPDVWTYCDLPIAFNRDTKVLGVMNNFTGTLGAVDAYITIRYLKSV